MELSVDDRFPLSFYYRIADQAVKQAKIYRDEGNTCDLYLTIDRYSRLVSKTIPQHHSFSKCSKEKLRHQKTLQEFIDESKKLKPLHGRKDCETDERAPGSPKSGEDTLLLTTRRCEGNDWACESYKMGKVSYCSTIGMETQKIESNFPKVNTKLASGIAVEARTSSALFQDYFPVALTAAREPTLKVHEVKNFFPSPVLSCTESLPLVGHVSYITIPESRNEYLESSCKESSASKVIQDVHISARLMEEFMELASANTNKDLETCGILGAFLENQIFFVTTLIVPKQESTSSSCQAINEEEIYAVQDEKSLFPAGWIHTHPSQTCFLSSIDLHTQYSYQVMLPEAVAIVMAPTDTTRSYGIFRLTDPGGMTVLKHCQEKGFHPHAETADGSPIFESCSNVYINPNLRFEIIDLRTSSP